MRLDFLKDKKVLVTGGNGFIGRNFVDALVKGGIRPRITVHNTPPFSSDVAEVIYANLTNAADCAKACHGVDFIIHAAGGVANAGSIRSNLIGTMVDNLVITTRLLEAASNSCKRMLIFSSGTTAYPSYTYPVKEEDMWTGSPDPVYFGYGWMRRYFELFGEYVSNASALDVVICRPTAPYGRYDKSNHVIPSLMRRALSGEKPFVIWGTGEEQRDFLHASDLVHGCLLLLEKGKAADPVNIGYGSAVTVKDVAKIIMKAVGRSEDDIVFDSSKPTTIPVRAVDCSKAKRLLDFSPELSLEAGIYDTVEWFKNNTRV